MKTTVRIDGLKELDAALAEFTKATAKGVLRRTGIKALQPMADTARQLAPDDPATGANDLKASIVVGGSNKLNARQKRLEGRAEGKAFVTVYMGTADVSGIQQEFGNINHGPQPFMRPAFSQHAESTIREVGAILGSEIKATAKRSVARAAKRAAKA